MLKRISTAAIICAIVSAPVLAEQRETAKEFVDRIQKESIDTSTLALSISLM